MCGLVGAAGKLNFKSDKAIKNLLILDALRGIDSTGIAAVHGETGEVRVVKQVGNPYDLIEHRSYLPVINRNNIVVIGHNRWATQGGVSRKTAHPFEFDNIVGAHNGTLTSRYKLEGTIQQFPVDSEQLFNHIDKKGVKDALSKMEGAWALVWWDKTIDTLNFLRNKERPLWMVGNQEGDQIFWASEKWMLEVALDRAEIKTKDYHWVAEDMHYSFEIDQNGVVAKPSVKNAPCTYPVIPTYPYQGGFNRPNVTTSTTPKTDGVNVAGVVNTTKNTLTLVEKKSNDDSKQKESTPRGYAASKGVRLELVALAVDGNGASYIDCLDLDNLQVDVRIYFKNGDIITTNIGKLVSADIKDVRIHKREGTYYKVARETVRVLEKQKIVIDNKKIVESIEDDVPFEADAPTVKDHRGRDITDDQFIQTYGTCASCTGFVDPAKQHKFTYGGECICNVCLSDPETMRYLPIVH